MRAFWGWIDYWATKPTAEQELQWWSKEPAKRESRGTLLSAAHKYRSKQVIWLTLPVTPFTLFTTVFRGPWVRWADVQWPRDWRYRHQDVLQMMHSRSLTYASIDRSNVSTLGNIPVNAGSRLSVILSIIPFGTTPSSESPTFVILCRFGHAENVDVVSSLKRLFGDFIRVWPFCRSRTSFFWDESEPLHEAVDWTGRWHTEKKLVVIRPRWQGRASVRFSCSAALLCLGAGFLTFICNKECWELSGFNIRPRFCLLACKCLLQRITTSKSHALRFRLASKTAEIKTKSDKQPEIQPLTLPCLNRMYC